MLASEKFLCKPDFPEVSSCHESSSNFPRKIIVGLKNSHRFYSSDLIAAASKYGGKITGSVEIKGKMFALALELESVSPAFLQEITSSEYVSFVEPNWEYVAHLVPNDPYWSKQWSLRKIGVDWAWNTTVSSRNVLVAVVDTGVDYIHSDLADNYSPLGYDWINDDDDPMDDEGHGTKCAGVIAAVLNNSLGIAGVANVSIMAEKSLNAFGIGYCDQLANGIIHAVDQGADIISISWGSYYYSTLVHEAVKYAYSKGALIIASAGNDHKSGICYPAGYEEVVAVSASGKDDTLASFSNFGRWIEVAAPGVNIYSTAPNNSYTYQSGTSMAAPHVAGVAALIWGKFPNKTRDWIRMQLRLTSKDLGEAGFDIKFGYGRVDAKKAVEQNPPTHDIVLFSSEYSTYVKPNHYAVFNATVLNFGSSSEGNLSVQLLVNGMVFDKFDVKFLEAGHSAIVALRWNASILGLCNVTVLVKPMEHEEFLENNVFSSFVYVGNPLKVVILDSEGNFGGFEIANWREINNGWWRLGSMPIYIDYATFRGKELTYTDLVSSKADVLIISCAWKSEYGFEFTDEEISAIRQYVQEGHGLIITELTFFSSAVNNLKLADLVGLNLTSPLTFGGISSLENLEPQHPILTGIPNVYEFPQTSCSVPVDGFWDENELSGGRYIARETSGKGVIVAFKRGRTYLAPWFEGLDVENDTDHLKLLYNVMTWTPHEIWVEIANYSKTVFFGENASVNFIVFNGGIVDEQDVKVDFLVNGELLNSTIISYLPSGDSAMIKYSFSPVLGWNNVTARVVPVKGEGYLINNSVTTHIVAAAKCDIALTSIEYRSWVYAGKVANVSVVASNLGLTTQCFNVSLYCNASVIETKKVIDLLPGDNITLVFMWDTSCLTPGGTYLLWAVADPLPNEINVENNVFYNVSVVVRLLGDVNGDSFVDVLDIVEVSSRFGARIGDPEFKYGCDVDDPWGLIDLSDLEAVASMYRERY